jgi:hypothetical protein
MECDSMEYDSSYVKKVDRKKSWERIQKAMRAEKQRMKKARKEGFTFDFPK